MSKPQGYSHSAAEAGFYMLVFCLPYYESLFYAGLGRTIAVLLLACLAMFLVARVRDICRAITACLIAFPSSWLTPARDAGFPAISFALLPVPAAPSLAPQFQRPPPIFA